MTTYVDSSVVLRLLFGEPDPLTQWTMDRAVSSELLRVECLRVVDRARMGQGLEDVVASRLRAAAMDLIAAISLVDVTNHVLDRAAEPYPTMLRTLDAIHLATALALREQYPDLSVATHDRELAMAAAAVGFEVLGS